MEAVVFVLQISKHSLRAEHRLYQHHATLAGIPIVWTVFSIYDIPTQLWVSRDLDKQGNLRFYALVSFAEVAWKVGAPAFVIGAGAAEFELVNCIGYGMGVPSKACKWPHTEHICSESRL